MRNDDFDDARELAQLAPSLAAQREREETARAEALMRQLFVTLHKEVDSGLRRIGTELAQDNERRDRKMRELIVELGNSRLGEISNITQLIERFVPRGLPYGFIPERRWKLWLFSLVALIIGMTIGAGGEGIGSNYFWGDTRKLRKELAEYDAFVRRNHFQSCNGQPCIAVDPRKKVFIRGPDGNGYWYFLLVQ